MRNRPLWLITLLACIGFFLSVAASPASAAPPKPADVTVQVTAPTMSLAELNTELAKQNALRVSKGQPPTTRADIPRCSHFDVSTRDYETCVNWIWNSITNLWRPGIQWVEKPTLACKISRLDGDFKINANTLVQRKGSPPSAYDYVEIGFNTTTLPGGGWYSDSVNPRVVSKVTTANHTGTTCNVVAHRTIGN